MARLFRVTVEVSFMVIAEDEYAAADWARENTYEWRDELDYADIHAHAPRSLTLDEAGSLPWLAVDDAPERTCAEWLLDDAKAKVTP